MCRPWQWLAGGLAGGRPALYGPRRVAHRTELREDVMVDRMGALGRYPQTRLRRNRRDPWSRRLGGGDGAHTERSDLDGLRLRRRRPQRAGGLHARHRTAQRRPARRAGARGPRPRHPGARGLSADAGGGQERGWRGGAQPGQPGLPGGARGQGGGAGDRRDLRRGPRSLHQPRPRRAAAATATSSTTRRSTCCAVRRWSRPKPAAT